MSLKGSFNASFALDNVCAVLCYVALLRYFSFWVEVTCLLRMKASHCRGKTQYLLCTATSLPRSLHLGLFCEIVLSSTPLPHHPLTSSSKHAMNPQQEIHWKPPAELLLKERSDTAVRNCQLSCIVCAFYWVLNLIWVMQVWNQMCTNFEKALNTPNCFIISF